MHFQAVNVESSVASVTQDDLDLVPYRLSRFCTVELSVMTQRAFYIDELQALLVMPVQSFFHTLVMREGSLEVKRQGASTRGFSLWIGEFVS